MKTSLILSAIIVCGVFSCVTNDKACRGSCLLKPVQTYVYLYHQPSTASTPVDSIINDTITEDYPILTINATKNEFAHVEIASNADSAFIQSGWIPLSLLGINPATTERIRLYKRPDINSEASCYIEHPCWGDLYVITDCCDDWLKIKTKEANVTKEGWIAPVDQCNNPYSACN